MRERLHKIAIEVKYKDIFTNMEAAAERGEFEYQISPDEVLHRELTSRGFVVTTDWKVYW